MFSPHTLQMFYVCPSGDKTYVQAEVQLVPNFLEHHLVNGHYCIVDAFPQLYQCLTADSDNFVPQQHGSPPHSELDVRDYLNQELPDRWIERVGVDDQVLFFPWPRGHLT